jgi:hypothetical protein
VRSMKQSRDRDRSVKSKGSGGSENLTARTYSMDARTLTAASPDDGSPRVKHSPRLIRQQGSDPR